MAEGEPSIPLSGPGDESSGRRRRASTRSGGDAAITALAARERFDNRALLLALIAGIVLGAVGWALIDALTDGDPFGGVVDSDRYQAVILSNERVYFGRIQSASDEFFELEDAYFLRETRENADAQPERTLLPINRELHAPDNTMLIRKDEVVLVENLDEKSPILVEIERQQGDK